MTRKEKMALKRQVHAEILSTVQSILTELRGINHVGVISFHEEKDRLINKAATNITNLLAADKSETEK